MGTATYDTVDDIKSLIESDWNIGSINAGTMPRVVKIWDEKTVGYGDSRMPIVLVQPKSEDIEYFNLYGTDFLHEVTISLDIRTYLNIENHSKAVSEIDRIIKENVRRTNFVDLRVVSSEPLSHLYRNMFRHVLEIKYRKMNP